MARNERDRLNEIVKTISRTLAVYESPTLKEKLSLVEELIELRAENERLKAKVLLGDDLADTIYPIINLQCEVTGTCKDCLEDGRGNHTEQCEYALERYFKASGSERDET